MKISFHENDLYISVIVVIIIASAACVIPVRIGWYERNYQYDITSYRLTCNSLSDADVNSINNYFKEDDFIALLLEDNNRMRFIDEWRKLGITIELVKLSPNQYYIRFDVYLPEYARGLLWRNYYFKDIHDARVESFLMNFVNNRLGKVLDSIKQSEYQDASCYVPNCDRVFHPIVLVGFCPTCPHSDRKKSPNCRALVVGLRR